MQVFVLLIGIVTIGIVLIDAFETIVLPRTVRRAIRLTTGYFWVMSTSYAMIGKTRHCPRRQAVLNMFAPMMLIGLIAVWAIAMIVGFACVLWGAGVPLSSAQPDLSFGAVVYYSGVSFFTLGFGDVVPSGALGRALAVSEAGVGLGFLALIIAYIPVIYSAFSRREVQMLLLDSRAGSEPTATEILRRYADAGAMELLTDLLRDWERFAAELLEAYLSYPVLAYYRSQHDEQNWLKSLTTIMDLCAIIDLGFEDASSWEASLKFQAKATFSMARHVVVDLAYILDAEPIGSQTDRLSPDGLSSLYTTLDQHGIRIRRGERDEIALRNTRALYEPFVAGLSKDLIMDLPEWIAKEHVKDNWETTAWDGVKHF